MNSYLIFLFFLPLAYLQERHYDDVPYHETEHRTVCESRTGQTCQRFLFWKRCSSHSYQHCYTIPYQVLRYRRVCHTGWSYPCNGCNIPICSNGCPTGKSCTYPNTCSCLIPGPTCKYVGCTAARNCYPGSCVGASCKCDPSFYGDNCDKSTKIPDIKDCTVKITDETNYVSIFNCSAVGVPSQIQWIRTSIKSIAVSYRVEYEAKSNDFPPGVEYVKTNRFGIVSSQVKLNWNDAGKETIKVCPGLSSDDPLFFKQCEIVWNYGDSGGNQNPFTNTIVNFTIDAKLGGYKQGVKSPAIAFSDFDAQQYTANFTAERFVTFKFDNTPPSHCLSVQGQSCPVFPIQIVNDITTNQRIRATMVEWKDTGSGIVNYNVAINYMQLNTDGKYADPKVPFKVFDVDPEHNEFDFDVTAPGVYSAVVTVKDLAGNEAKARNIFTYTGGEGQRVDANKPVRCVSCDPASDYKGINTPGQNMDFDWTGHFITKNNGIANNNLGGAVVPWSPGEGIDDVAYDTPANYSYGSRTINALDKNFEVSVFYGYNINSTNPFPDSWTQTTKDSVTVAPVVPWKTGDVVRFFLRCNYLDGSAVEESLSIVHDYTPLVWGLQTRFSANDPDEFFSKFYFDLEDPESGLKSMTYTIRDTTKNVNLVQNSTATIWTREPVTNIKKFKRAAIEQPCRFNDTTCYCSSIGYCYPKQQYIVVDHCVIDRYLDDHLEMQVVAVNNAGKLSYKTIDLGNPKDLKCRPTGLSSGAIAGIIIGVLLGLILLILLIIFLVWVFVLRRPLAPYDNFKKRFTKHDLSAAAENDLYTADNPSTGVGVDRRQIVPQNASAFSNVAFNKDDDGEIKERDMLLNEELSSSNFVVSKAVWLNDNKKITVATKGNKHGVNAKMKADLNNKIDLYRKLPDHLNLIKFFGAVGNFKGRGPLIVMEYCPMTLKEWLERADVSPDVLDDMSLFSLNIAKGVEFLHDKRIIHKRLALRNILLAKYYNQYIAKITGYGQKPDTDSTISVPIRWLAPETVSTLKKDRPTYNEKTDSWAFGITLWEIYTFGSKKPYPELSNNDAQQAIMNGTLMEIPENMPKQIYNTVMAKCCQKEASNRPSFQRISNEMEDFRSGVSGGGGKGGAANKPGYYSPDDEDFYNASGGYKDIYNDCA